MKQLHRNLTVQVLVAIALGVLVGVVSPDTGKAMRVLGDTFITLVKMVITPIIFLTVVLGIANMRDLRKVGRVGGKALLYFEIVTTFALAIGMHVANVTRPGEGLDVAALSGGDVSKFTEAGKSLTFVELFTHIVPSSVVAAFATGDVLQVVFFAVLFGAALASVGEAGAPLSAWLDILAKVFFRIVAVIMKVAPIGAFGAMAFTVGTFGLKSLLPLGKLMLDVYLTMFLFIFVVLNLILRASGFSLWNYLTFIREEVLIVLGTSSSEAALPRMIDKMERYGCSRSIVGLVIPAGYSFNLDGTSIYLSMAALFVTQAFGVHLTLPQQLSMLGVLMLTSKGAAGVTGSGFIVLASTLSAMHVVPLQGVAILLGVDRFMSEARAITNLIGNGAATLVISRSEQSFDESVRVRAIAELRAERAGS